MSWTPSHRSLQVAWALGALTLASRLPFAAHRLWDHDSVQFALGVEAFDLAAHHPHPPGYPVYIALLKLLAELGVEAVWGMVGLSILASSMGAFFMVLLGAGLGASAREASADEAQRLRSGALAGALFAWNPMLWFYGELPLVYAVEAGASVGLAYGVLRMAQGGPLALILTCGSFALVGGLRPSTLVLLSPLFLYGTYTAWRSGGGRRRFLGAGLLVGLGTFLAWAVPLIVAAGGLDRYRGLSSEHFGFLLPETSILFGAGLPAAAHNMEVLLKWALQGITPGAVILLLLWSAAPRAIRPGLSLLRSHGVPLLLWIAPPVAFFALFHVTKAGYTLVYLPALLLALALAATPALSRARGAVAILAVGVLGSALFVFGSTRTPDQPRVLALVLQEFHHRRIRRYEAELDRVRLLVEAYPPETTALVTVELAGRGAGGSQGFLPSWHRHLQWYLPAYPVRLLVPGGEFALVTRGHRPVRRIGRRIALGPGCQRVLFILAASPGERLPLPVGRLLLAGKRFYVLECEYREGMTVGPFQLVEG